MVLDVRVGGGLVEDTVMSGLGGVGRVGGFNGRYSNEWIGWCWTLGLVEVWWKIQ